jgi:hypothetical protein
VFGWPVDVEELAGAARALGEGGGSDRAQGGS